MFKQVAGKSRMNFKRYDFLGFPTFPVNTKKICKYILGDPEVTANIYWKSRNLPNTDTQNYSTDLR